MGRFIAEMEREIWPCKGEFANSLHKSTKCSVIRHSESLGFVRRKVMRALRFASRLTGPIGGECRLQVVGRIDVAERFQSRIDIEQFIGPHAAGSNPLEQ